MDNNSKVLKAYESAKAVYKDLGIDTDKVIDSFYDKRISLHCWQGDDIKGFEGAKDVATQNVVTGNYPYAARNPQELRQDIEMVFSLAPTKHKVNLHSVYAEPSKPTSRENLDISAFKNWIDWAKTNNLGLDYNGSFFAHEMMDNGMSLSSPKKEVRDFWIKHMIGSREIAYNMGKAMNDKCVNNTWIPDGLKDNPADRLYFRTLLKDSLDKGFAKKYDGKFLVDALEGKLFGIGTESFVTGSYDFYLSYCAKNNIGLCIDSGHFHPTESVADKLSALKLFFDDILLHISRGIRWDSDHAVIADEGLTNIMFEANRAGMLDSLNIGLDYFDASINRIFAWAVGLRSAERVMLSAMLEPTDMLKKAEMAGDYGTRLAIMEEQKALPTNAIWDMACLNHNVPTSFDWIKKVEEYTKNVLAKRG